MDCFVIIYGKCGDCAQTNMVLKLTNCTICRTCVEKNWESKFHNFHPALVGLAAANHAKPCDCPSCRGIEYSGLGEYVPGSHSRG